MLIYATLKSLHWCRWDDRCGTEQQAKRNLGHNQVSDVTLNNWNPLYYWLVDK